MVRVRGLWVAVFLCHCNSHMLERMDAPGNPVCFSIVHDQVSGRWWWLEGKVRRAVEVEKRIWTSAIGREFQK